MKNKLLIFFIFYFLLGKTSFAEPFIFKTKEIEIRNEGNLILAKDGIALSADNNLEIEAENYEYYKDVDLLKAFNGTAQIKSDDLEIQFNEIEIDQKNSIFTAKNNVKIFERKKKLSIETSLITYNYNLKVLDSKTQSILRDQFDNIFDTQSFNYNINKEILKINKANFKDTKNNNFYVDLAFINTTSNKMFGKDIEIDLNNESFNKNNEPRLKGNSIIYEEDYTEITKGIFTTCKKNDNCPPWQLSAEKIQHDKKKQVINYQNAWLKVYDVPVMYFPKFFHPDPTVKRRSGFLIPTFKSSSNSKNSYLSVPYFQAISLSNDMTFTPRFYSDDKILLQTEYRKINANSTHLSDFSFYKEKNGNSKNHVFYRYNKDIDFAYFEENAFSLKVEKTSNDTYLKANEINSPIIENFDTLENSINISLYSDELWIDTDIIVYENLTEEKKSDKYEFILPNINLVKKIDNKTNLNGNFTLESSNLIRNYETNIFEKYNINDLVFNSSPKIYNNGIYNNYDFIIKNVNSDSQNSDDFKEGGNIYLSGMFQFNSSLPLIKENNKFQNILTPKLALKMSPNHTNDISESEERIDVNNIYSLDRVTSSNTLEGGMSLTYGSDYTIYNKQNSSEIFGFKIANNLRIEENKNLPRNAQLGDKTSNIFNEIFYNPSEFLKLKYNISLKNNIQDISYENLIAEFSVNNFVTKFDYINENNTSNKNSYLLNTTEYALNESNSIKFSTRENKTSDLTEYYNLMYQYKNDCLAASIEYNKNYYDDRDVKPEENIFLKLTIIPFGETSSPNLKN